MTQSILQLNFQTYGGHARRQPKDVCFISYWDGTVPEERLLESWFSDSKVADWLIQAYKGSWHRLIKVDVQPWDPDKGESEPPIESFSREENSEWYDRVTQGSIGFRNNLYRTPF